MTQAATIRLASILMLVLNGSLLLLLLACIGLSSLGSLAAIRAVFRRDTRFLACLLFLFGNDVGPGMGTLHFLMH